MNKKIIILVAISFFCFNSFSQNLSIASSNNLIFSKTMDESNKILTQSGFDFNESSTSTSTDRGRNYAVSSFFKKLNGQKEKKDEILIYRQNGSIVIEKMEYHTSNAEIFAAYKKNTEQTFKKLGDKIDSDYKMESYRGEKLLETFQTRTVKGIKLYTIIFFNLLAPPFK